MNSLKNKDLRSSLLVILFISYCNCLFAQNNLGITGKWVLIPDESSALSYYNTINLDIQQENTTLRIVQKWESKFPKIDSVQLSTSGEINKSPVNNRVWPFQVFMGVSMIPGSEKEVTAKWIAKDSILQVKESYPVLISQGKVNMNGVRTYTLSNDGQKLTLNIFHNSDRSNSLTYVFRRG